jgi:hypothetical protein
MIGRIGDADAERIRRIERRARDQHGSKTDERMERRHKLRHVRHGDTPRRDRADAAANAEAADHQRPRYRVRHAADPQGREDRDGHADHAIAIARARRRRRRQPAQRHDEGHAADEIKKGCDIGFH